MYLDEPEHMKMQIDRVCSKENIQMHELYFSVQVPLRRNSTADFELVEGGTALRLPRA